MRSLIDRYILKLTKDDINKIALKKGIVLNTSELEFTYNFLKLNYKKIITNRNNFNIDNYQDNYSEENFKKIKIFLKNL